MDRRINIRFFDENLKFIGELDQYVGLEFISRWMIYGEFKLFVHGITKIMKKGNFIMLDNDRRKTGIIKRIVCSDDTDVNAEVDGFTLAHLLTQRCTIPPAGHAYHEFNAPAEDIICALVRANMVDAVDSRRNMPLLEIYPSQGRGDRVHFQTRYNKLSDDVESLCRASGLGICVELDPKRRKLVFRVLNGVDRSAENGVRPPMVFNVAYDNVESREYISDMSEYKNVAITAGQGDGTDRVIHIEGEENAGMERYELFVDARDIEDAAQLPDRGKAKLAEYRVADSYSSVVDASQYQEKWDLGDIVVTKDEEYGVYMNERVVEVNESFDENGYMVSPTFGTIVKTILDKVEDTTKNQPKLENTKGDPGEPGQDGERGPQGYSLQYDWKGTQLGVKREDETSYEYADLRGAKGEKGEPGEQGIQGIPGEKGERGEIGPPGPQGPQGEQGERGPQGIQGPVGSTQSYILFQKDFISTEGQKDFSWTDYKFPLGVNALALYINGVRQTGESFTEKASGQGIALKNPLPAGYFVFLVGFQMVVDLQGPKGEKGDAGSMGPPGLKGEKGEKGDKGDTGKQGLQGERGPQGIQGAAGITPTIGSNGNWFLGTVDTGKPARGAAGPQGIPGEKGNTGEKGERGPQGNQGIQGPPGPQGPQGEQGIQGPPGSTNSYIRFERSFISAENQSLFSWTGNTYPLGIKAVELYVNGVRQENNTYTEKAGGTSIQLKIPLPAGYRVYIVAYQMVVDLRGPKGDQGQKGDKGDTGERGATGAQGIQGIQGKTGATGPQGPAGVKGADGITPTIGSNGNWYLGSVDTGKPSRGATGAQGPMGKTGATGPQGVPGQKGDTGARGATGAQGPAGAQGAKGADGITPTIGCYPAN